MHEVLGVTDVFKSLPVHKEIDQDTINQILEQAAKFAKEVVQPLNQNGDRQGCTRHPDATVTTPFWLSGCTTSFANLAACSRI